MLKLHEAVKARLRARWKIRGGMISMSPGETQADVCKGIHGFMRIARHKSKQPILALGRRKKRKRRPAGDPEAETEARAWVARDRVKQRVGSRRFCKALCGNSHAGPLAAAPGFSVMYMPPVASTSACQTGRRHLFSSYVHLGSSYTIRVWWGRLVAGQPRVSPLRSYRKLYGGAGTP